MTCRSVTDAYDKASLAVLNMACAARLLLNSSPDEHTSEMGHNERDFLLASILDNAKVADQGLRVLSPYSDDAASPAAKGAAQ
jgi:hypothetical protein